MSSLPEILAGPILRHATTETLTFWLVTPAPVSFTFTLYDQDIQQEQLCLSQEHHVQTQVGVNAFIHQLTIPISSPLQTDHTYSYDLLLQGDGQQTSLSEILPSILYETQKRPSFVIREQVDRLLHGSCRKPHFAGKDGLLRVDQAIADTLHIPEQRPAMLLMSGDQVYVDDVAGPFLQAIHQVIELLGLYEESWQGTPIHSSDALYRSEHCYYHRDKLLPHTDANKAVYDKLFAYSKKPIFTSVNAKNHLVTLAECLAMYFLVWSPQLWSKVRFSTANILPKDIETFEKERVVIEDFVNDLPQVSRALAQIPTYMIFDDHDITDDWNLTRGWEEAAYTHPFSKRIIGNALVAYLLCQGWGNAPDKFKPIEPALNKHFAGGYLHHDELIDSVLAWQDWHYTLETQPKIVVLDTRTQRWRSESRASKPSGLMDWEALSAMQQELINEPKVILVSAAPIYGVKMIEAIQRVFTFFGQPLMVDAENWMAHKGTANVMLNIFKHVKTPPEFIILSGDVHYSFVYDVTHRFKRNKSKIIQVTNSGIKNQFPTGLLRCLDRLNRILYAPYSPLNWFTKRRHMKVTVRKPWQGQKDTLANASGIGDIRITGEEDIVQVNLLTAEGNDICFEASKSKKPNPE